MVDNSVLKKLFNAFDCSYMSRFFEFITDENPRIKAWFRLDDCETEEDVQAKVLEWLSRSAYKSEPFRNQQKNSEVHKYHLDGINSFLGTNFTPEDIAIIYCELGNAADKEKTRKFIRSNYNMEVLKSETY